MENIAAQVSTILGNLGGSVLVMAVMFLLGLIFQAGFSKSLRGGIYAGIGLAGLNVIVNQAVGQLTPAIQAFSERFSSNLSVADIGWGSSGIAFAWPGLAFVILGILAVNAVMVLLKVTKTMWTDIWSIWHGNVVGGFVWAATGGNVTLGVLAGVLFLAIGSLIADLTAKDYQDFNSMPGISVPCTVNLLGLTAKGFNRLIEAVPGLRDINASPENIRKKMGVFGELGVIGAVIGTLIGVLAGYSYGPALNLGFQVGVLMVFLPKTVSVLCEGVIPVANAITEFIQDHFEGRELYVGVDCAALLGHPSVMAAAVLLYPLIIVLAVLLPGNSLLPIASLALVPYWCGACAAQLKGNVFRIVLFILIWSIPVFYIASAMAPVHTETMGLLGLADPASMNSSLDMGGDPLGGLLVYIFHFFG
ncbi:PTS galactitol transporter subunit IIC [Clostridiaceae bacterium]|nr:PTS galactitol transporter subunit IIC [Clostridiaceae bacterium]RKJ81941.1 PTS galactitol transporter subunit IIC [Butyricicoccus sp. 1XD8-22]